MTVSERPDTEIILYQTEDGRTRIEVRANQETVWLSQTQMVELFQSSKANISEHIKHVFDEGELVEEAVVRKFRTTAADGKTYQVTYYNLDVIISVGYRVRSLRGTQFRQWALAVLKEYLVKGFAMHDEVLKQAGGGSYWRELLSRIRDIRSSEKVFYRQVLDLYATSIDYDPRASESLEFFAVVQNKMHYAAHGHTAAEVIHQRADAAKPFMGLTVFDGAQPRRSEVVVAKNYLSEEELATLNRMVSAFLDLAELRATQHVPMYMKDWIAELDDFANRYGKGVLPGAGGVSHQQAVQHAEMEYDGYLRRMVEEPSGVERDYLESIKKTQKSIERKPRSA